MKRVLKWLIAGDVQHSGYHHAVLGRMLRSNQSSRSICFMFKNTDLLISRLAMSHEEITRDAHKYLRMKIAAAFFIARKWEVPRDPQRRHG